jgi:D-beta-D-heptose 7-phosphate kinase/D-beta-D-heptose 1-phosphate adenosyltransferase
MDPWRSRGKLLSRRTLIARVRALQRAGRTVVFTNGCFDLLHLGHVRYLEAARKLGDVLVVGVNSDASVRRLKGPQRPLVGEKDRAQVLAALAAVDWVTIFSEDTPYELIAALRPDVLVKGGDWQVADIVGADLVRAYGGRVRSLPYLPGYSTTALVRRIAKAGASEEERHSHLHRKTHVPR